MIESRPAKSLSALKIGDGNVKVLLIKSLAELSKLYEFYRKGERIHVLGEGTNSVFGSYSGIVVKLNLLGYKWEDEHTLTISAGEHWQKAIELSVDKNLVGIERMASIPGSVGAAPVQNIGAFGYVLKDTLLKVQVYDYTRDIFLDIPASECGLGAHRASNFKDNPDWKSYCITAITLCLKSSNDFSPPAGDGLLNFVNAEGLTLKNVREAERAIRLFRGSIYPDYTKVPNTGSYFTNYELPVEQQEAIPNELMNIKHKVSSDGKRIMFQCKDLLHSIGIEGGHVFEGGLQMYEQHNNFLINPDSIATVNDLLLCHEFVNKKLNEKYGITLIPEADFIDDVKARSVT